MQRIQNFTPLNIIVILGICVNTYLSRMTGGMQIVSLADDLIIMAIFSIFLYTSFSRGKISQVGALTLLLYLFIIIVTVVSKYQSSPFAYVFATFSSISLFFLISATPIFTPKFIDDFSRVNLFIIVLGFAIEFISPKYFFNMVNLDGIDRTYDRAVGFYLNPNRLGVTCAFLILYYYYVKNNIVISLLLACAIVLSESDTAIIYIMFFVTVFSWNRAMPLSIKYLIMTAVFFGSIYTVYYVFTSGLIQYIQETLFPRVLFLMNGLRLAVEFFPFGTGAATYGSAFSEDSKIYDYLGISNVWYIKEYFSVRDSELGSFLGEFGFLTIIIMIVTLTKYFRTISSKPNIAISFTVAIFLFSAVRPVIGSVFFAVLFVYIVSIFYHMDSLKQRDR